MQKMESNLLEYARMTEQKQYIEKIRLLLQERGSGMPLACVHSYGCQQNVADGEKLSGLLAEMGYGFTQVLDEADLVLYNTCAVRENAEKRVFGNVGALKHYKRRRPGMIIALAGCMTQQQQVADRLKKSYPHVDIVVGTNSYGQLPRLIYEKLAFDKRYIKSGEEQENAPVIEGIPLRREGGFKAWVPVMYGCDNFCSYCIVPYVRGRERSRPWRLIVQEVEDLVRQGYKEVTLLGQNVNSYGKGLEEPLDFAGLLRKLDALPGDFIIRFMTSHPKDCTRELLDTMAECPKVERHLHLPVQCGSDRVLAEMNRRYTVDQYLELIRYAKERMPDIALTSDIIVGFPGETREDFEKTLDLVRRVGYTSLFTFIYSRRSGTRAETLPDPVPAEEKSRWFRELLEVQNAIGEEILRCYVGRTLRVLPEGVGKDGEGTLTSRTAGNIIVEIPGGEELVGRFANVEITGSMNWALTGRLAGA